MEITVLVENTRIDRSFKKGHGLSILVNFEGKKYLFDAGPNRKLLSNGKRLNEPLTDLAAVIISHGHSDHTGGLRFLSLQDTPLYTAQHSTAPHFLKVLHHYLYVGVPKDIRQKLQRTAQTVTEMQEIAPDVYVIPLGETNRITKNLYKEQEQEIVHDNFSDECMLVVDESKGLTVFTGCSHHGIVEMAEAALAAFPKKAIRYLIGGFHMIGVPYLNNLGMRKEEVAAIGHQLNQLPVEKILTCHCTGERAFVLLKEQLGEKLEAIRTGEQRVLH